VSLQSFDIVPPKSLLSIIIIIILIIIIIICYIMTLYLLCTNSIPFNSGLSVFNKELIDRFDLLPLTLRKIK